MRRLRSTASVMACAALVLSSAGLAAAQAPPLATGRTVPSDAVGMKQSFAPIVRRAAPAVVNVHAQRRTREQVDPFWEMFGGGVPRERIAQSLGSGVIVGENGVIVTNNHVIEGGEEIRVALADRREFPAKVLLADPRADLAVLKIDVGNERLPVLPLSARDDAEVGDKMRNAADVLRDQSAFRIRQRGAKVAHLVDHHIIRGALQIGRHFVGDGRQRVANDFECDRIYHRSLNSRVE